MMTMTGNIDKEKTPSTSTQNELSRDKLEQFLRGRASEASETNYVYINTTKTHKNLKP